MVFSKLSLNDAELNFRNTVAGLHTFCLRLSQKSKTHADTIASPRVRPQLRTVTVDVQVGSKIVHGKLQDEDLATMMEEVSGVQMSVQVGIHTVPSLCVNVLHNVLAEHLLSWNGRKKTVLACPARSSWPSNLLLLDSLCTELVTSAYCMPLTLI